MSRDVQLEDTFTIDFTTRAFATGIPTTLAGTPVLSVHEEGNDTFITAGVSVDVDIGTVAVTGLNEATIVATAANGYATDTSYSVFISTGTVGGVSVVGEVIGTFTVQSAPVNWAKVSNPTTALDLSSTDIQLVDTTTANTDMRGTDSAALASVLGALNDVAAAGDVTTADTIMQYLKQVINLLAGGPGIGTNPGAAVPANAVNMFEILNSLSDRLPSALVSGAMDSDVSAMQSSVIIAATYGAGARDAAGQATDAVNEIRDAMLPTQNVAFNFKYVWVAASDHVTPVTGATTTSVTRSLDGGAFGAASGTLSEIANGVYRFAASAGDMNGGEVTFRFVATGGTPGAPDDAFVHITTGGGV